MLIKEEVEMRFIEMVIEFVKKEGLTIANIQDAMYKVNVYMEDNAVIKI